MTMSMTMLSASTGEGSVRAFERIMFDDAPRSQNSYVSLQLRYAMIRNAVPRAGESGVVRLRRPELRDVRRD